MFLDGFALGSLTVGAFWLVYQKLPARVKRFLEKHALLTDALALYATYILLGGGITALFAAAWAGILTSVLLYVANHPDDFQWLQDFVAFSKEKAGELKAYLTRVGQEYREKKAREAATLSLA